VIAVANNCAGPPKDVQSFAAFSKTPGGRAARPAMGVRPHRGQRWARGRPQPPGKGRFPGEVWGEPGEPGEPLGSIPHAEQLSSRATALWKTGHQIQSSAREPGRAILPLVRAPSAVTFVRAYKGTRCLTRRNALGLESEVAGCGSRHREIADGRAAAIPHATARCPRRRQTQRIGSYSADTVVGRPTEPPQSTVKVAPIRRGGWGGYIGPGPCSLGGASTAYGLFARVKL
jgi:hypothetical protein